VNLRLLFLLVLIAAASAPVHAGGLVLQWPGVAPCATTLQACVDAASNGSVIQIVTDTPIPENINLYNRSLSLVAGSGYHPNFAAGFWISASTAPISGDVSVSLTGLRLQDSYVRISYNGTGTGTYDVRGMTLNQSTGGAPTYIQLIAASGTTNAMLYDNRVSGLPASLNSGLIQIDNTGATLNVSAYYNHVRSTSDVGVNGGGIFVNETSGGMGTVKLHGNEVQGGFFRSGIFVSEGLFSSTTSTFSARVYNNVVVCSSATVNGGSGISFTANNGSINAQAVNNTLSRCYTGISANQWSGGSATARVDGLVTNNLVVAVNGLQFSPSITPSLTNDYNLINASSNFATLGTHTLTAPAQLVADSAPRLLPGSPAIDAADSATLGFGLLFNTLPVTDADGLRRITGASSNADIGAYESGDLALLHTTSTANTSTYISTIDNPLVNGVAAANLIVTANFNAGGGGTSVANNHPVAAYYSSSRWRIFNEDAITPMPLGTHFNTFSPAAGGGSFRHVTSAANTSSWTTTLDDSSVNNLPDRIVLATQNWSAGSGIYNAHPIGVFYFALGGPGSWLIANADTLTGGDLPINAGFNVYAQEPSPNAFRVTVPGTGSASSVTVDHPLLNGVACAQLNVSRIYNGTAVLGNFDVYFTSGQWRIFAYGGMPAGTQFNVVVDPAQVFACTDRIFANGFE
jgi:hypothetical protein